MKIKVEVEKAQYKYVAYFDAYADAQSEIADFLRKCLQEDTLRKVSLDALMEVTDHYTGCRLSIIKTLRFTTTRPG